MEAAAFLEPLPENIAKSLQRQGPFLSFDDFIKWLSPARNSNAQDVGDIGRHVIQLHKLGRKKVIRPDTHTRKRLSLSARKVLGLYTLTRHELSYSQLLPVHELWKDYMRQLLCTSQLEILGWDNSTNNANLEQVSLKLYRADYHGAYITVIKSMCPSLVGCSGLVAMETKNCFKLVGKDNLCRCVPKKSCEFETYVDDFKLTWYGHNMIVRPADRSSKKLKLIRPPYL